MGNFINDGCGAVEAGSPDAIKLKIAVVSCIGKNTIRHIRLRAKGFLRDILILPPKSKIRYISNSILRLLAISGMPDTIVYLFHYSG